MTLHEFRGHWPTRQHLDRELFQLAALHQACGLRKCSIRLAAHRQKAMPEFRAKFAGARKQFFDQTGKTTYAANMRGNLAKTFDRANLQRFRHAPLPRSYTNYLGRQIFLFLLTVQGLAAFAMITLGVLLKKSRAAHSVMQPRIRQEIHRSGVALLPMFSFWRWPWDSW